jgi:hypothetical protein
MASGDSKIEKIQKHFQTLSSVATSLNAASDELTKVVAILDESLKKLNVGLTAWVTFRSRGDDDQSSGNYNCDQIGYCKVNGKWGIALRHIWGNVELEVERDEGPWLFNDAPREMRVRGVDKIPEVIETLSEEAAETTTVVRAKTEEIRSLAGAITQITNSEKQATKAPAAPPPYARQQTPPSYPPPYVKTSIPTLADMADPNPQSVPQTEPTMRDMASGKKGGK